MKKIAVIGSINMDMTVNTERIPKKGETLLGSALRYIPGGKGANQAVAAARLGGCVSMFGCVGEDIFADRLIENLRENGVDTTHIRRISGVSSGIAMITVAENDNSIVVIPGANHRVTPDFLETVKGAVLEADIIVLQNEIPPETVQHAINICHTAGKMILYNPAPAMPLAEDVRQKISYMTPNEHEATLLFPEEKDLCALVEAKQGRLIVTMGAEGVMAWGNGKLLKIPARAVDVVDTTGAGDTFNGAFAYALANDYPMEKALHFATIAASLSTESFGAQAGMPILEQVQKCEERWNRNRHSEL